MKARRASSSRVSAESTAPPPSAITAGSGPSSTDAATPASISLNPASPSRAKISSIVVPAARSISLIEVDEGPAEPARDLAPERRLARAHEAGEREVAA